MLKKSFVLVLTLVMIVSLAPLVLAQDSVEIWHVFPEGTHFIREAVSRWNENNEDFKVSETYLPFSELKRQVTQGLMTGEGPDIFIVDNPDLASFAEMGALANIDEKVKEWGKKDLYYDGPINSVTYNGSMYGIPLDSNTICLYYNKDMFEDVGLDGTPDTWEELVEYSKELTDPDKNTKGIAFSAKKSEEGTFQFLPFVQQAGGNYKELDSKEAISALELWQSLVLNGWASSEVINITQNEAVGLLASGNVGMAISGPWSIPLMENADFEWGVAMLPYKEGVGVRSSALGGFNMSIMKESSQINESWEFIKWLQSEEVMSDLYWDYLDGARIPARSDIAEDSDKWVDDPILSVFIDQLEFAEPRGPHPNWPEISSYIQNAIQKALSDQATAETAMKEAANQINSIID